MCQVLVYVIGVYQEDRDFCFFGRDGYKYYIKIGKVDSQRYRETEKKI